jgi:hypothetical protein
MKLILLVIDQIGRKIRISSVHRVGEPRFDVLLQLLALEMLL